MAIYLMNLPLCACPHSLTRCPRAAGPSSNAEPTRAAAVTASHGRLLAALARYQSVNIDRLLRTRRQVKSLGCISTAAVYLLTNMVPGRLAAGRF